MFIKQAKLRRQRRNEAINQSGTESALHSFQPATSKKLPRLTRDCGKINSTVKIRWISKDRWSEHEKERWKTRGGESDFVLQSKWQAARFYFFFLLNTQGTISTQFGLVLHKDYCVTERFGRKLQNPKKKTPKNDSKEITACFQAWSVKSVWAFHTHHQTSFPGIGPDAKTRCVPAHCHYEPFKSHIMVRGNRDVWQSSLKLTEIVLFQNVRTIAPHTHGLLETSLLCLYSA